MPDLPWWQKAVFYQVYPRSFADSNGDGISDFPGMTAKLDYLQDLGIDAIWLSPHYPSPFLDCGYDIADYTGVAPEYGTLDDFKRFLDEAHRREIRIILDLVLNHTSHQHPWFLESCSSRENPRRDWYLWRDGRDGSPPNNWSSLFGGSAWQYHPPTGQWYYHMFLKEQPDLNWRNPQVKAAMFAAVRFWLDLGVDGYRLDAIDTVFEHPGFPDHQSPKTLQELFLEWRQAETPQEQEQAWEHWQQLFHYQVQQPGLHELLQELRAVVDQYPGKVLVGETDELAYCGDGTNELHMVFNFPLMRQDRITPASVRANQQERLSALPPGGWPANTLGNHDSSRLLSRYGDGAHDTELARLLLALMLTLRGTPFLYYGEEIGMTDLVPEDLSQVCDMMAVRQYEIATQEMGLPPEMVLPEVLKGSRDRCRTPMQWLNAANAGFCPPGVTPWLPVNPNYAAGVNVAAQLADPGSLLNAYKQLLAVRRSTPALIAGDYTPLHPQAEEYLAFLRSSPEDRQACLVVLNFSAQSLDLSFDLPPAPARLVYSSRERGVEAVTPAALHLEPFEVRVLEVRV